MKIHVSVLKLIGLLLATVATNFNLYAQEPEEDELDLLLDELFFSDQSLIEDVLDSFIVTNSIYANVSYSSNTYFYGRDSGIDQFSIVPQISYYSPTGFNISVSGLYYENYSPNWDFTNVSLGYYNTIGKKELLNYNLGYTRFFYSDNYDAFNNSFDLNVGLRNRSRNLGTNISTSYLFGSDKSLQVVSNSYGKIYLLKKNKFSLKLRPEISFIVVNQSISYQRIRLENGEPIIQTLNLDIFDLVNTQVNIPLSLSTKSWDFEIGYTTNFPNAVVADRKIDSTGFINISAGYFIDLN
jgi:hypothetical protein